MGSKANDVKRATLRTIRAAPLTESERTRLLGIAVYEGRPLHKRNPGDFGLTPPAAPRPDKTLCDEAGVLRRSDAQALLVSAINRGLVSEATTPDGFPKQMWTVDERGRVFEAMYGGSTIGRYHGYPIRRVDPLFEEPAGALARWLLVNWWRLRWEPSRQGLSFDWLRSHSVAAIGGGYAWPPLTLASDGEFIQLRLEAEPESDVSALRYLRDVTIDIPVADFEHATDEFLDRVNARLQLRAPRERELAELREELARERGDSLQSAMCRRQALAGLDPGTASEGWLRTVRALTETAGDAVDEILAIAPSLPRGLEDAGEALGAMSRSPTNLNLGWASIDGTQSPPGEAPWERGARLANELRRRIGLPAGPVTRKDIEELFEATLPLPRTAWTGSRVFRGGVRVDERQSRTAVLVTCAREDNQRFFMARLAGAALQSSEQQRVLPVSDAATAFQKFERSFAQEFLCPWRDLDAFTDQFGTDDDGIADAAAHFEVSERLVLSTLVNKGKVSRSRLPPS